MILAKKSWTEFQNFCDSASTHGLAYFFKFTLLERLLWVTITTIMFILGSVLINQMRLDWSDNPSYLLPQTRYADPVPRGWG